MSAGKGKTPLRRSNNLALTVAASADQTSMQVSESSCEKSCQVTSEQIKADMRAAAEKSKSKSSKGITPEAGETTARPGDNSGSVWGTGSAGGEATGTEVKPGTGSVGREGPGVGTSRQVGGCGSVVAGPTHTATTTDMTIDSAEGTSGAQAEDSCPREAGVSQSSGPAVVNSLDSTGAAGNHGSRRPALLPGQGVRQPAASSSSQQDHVRDHDFVPRRPLTRSCTRLSSVSLVPETGKTDVKNTEAICVHQL